MSWGGAGVPKRGPRALATARSYNAERRRDLVEDGICRTCLSRPASPGRTTCAECRSAGAERMRTLRASTDKGVPGVPILPGMIKSVRLIPVVAVVGTLLPASLASAAAPHPYRHTADRVEVAGPKAVKPPLASPKAV